MAKSLSELADALTSPFRRTTGFARWILAAGLLLVASFVVLAIFAPWIAPYDFAQTRYADGARFPNAAPPGGRHLLGTTSFGPYDVWSRVVWGSRTALQVIVTAVLLALLVGVPLGVVSGFLGGTFDRFTVLLMDALFAFPSLLLAIVFSFLLADKFGGGVAAAGVALTVIYVPQYFRVVRNTTVSAKEATYVEAARAIGAPKRTIMGKYVFGNVIQSVPVIGTLNAADALGTLAALGFLGLGIQPNQAAEWGYDLNRALPDASAEIWWTGVFPGLAIVLLITGLTLIGEGLNETINPTLRRRKLRPFTLPPRGAAMMEHGKGQVDL